MEKIAIIGSKDLILGFNAFGIDTFPSEDGGSVLEILKKIKQEGKHGIILITKELADTIPQEDFQKETSAHLPAVLVIPGVKTKDEEFLLKLRKLGERAIGSDILK